MAGYDFQLIVKDIYNTSTALDDMPTKEVFLDVNETTGSMGFGGEASDDADVVRYDFYGPIYARSGIIGGMIYSTSEVDTGNSWIDGKRIYSRILTYATPSTVNATTRYAFDMSAMDNIWIDVSTTFLISPAGNIVYPPGYVAGDNGRQFMVQLARGSNEVVIVSDSAGTAYVRVLYTKN